jgi:hypothetical protein
MQEAIGIIARAIWEAPMARCPWQCPRREGTAKHHHELDNWVTRAFHFASRLT